MIRVNLRGMFLVAQTVARVLVDQGGGGVIVNMSSTNGLGGEADYAHYNASKGGVLLLTKTMAVELGRYGIRVNALCPGFIETPLNAAISAGLGGKDFAAAYASDHIPMGRLVKWPRQPRCTRSGPDDATVMTGAELVIDGGARRHVSRAGAEAAGEGPASPHNRERACVRSAAA
jgi:3-oxoacyl-[acyl-carrier protein] reductase